MKAKTALDIMTEPVVTIGPDALLTDAIKLLLRHHVSGLPVVDRDGRLVGMITERDILNFALSGDAADTSVQEAMTPDVVTFGPNDTVEELVACLGSRHIRRVPIIHDQRVVGIVSRRDILREMLSMYAKY